MSEIWSVIVFIIALCYLLFAIMKLKMNPFFAMMTGAVLTGILIRMSPVDMVNEISTGFGGILGSLGIVIGLGSLLGALLNEAGATQQLANGVLAIAGKKKASLAMNAIGYIVSIPVYMGSAYIILNPLCRRLAKDTKKNVVVYTTALAIGLTVTHCLVIPTPGPLAVSATLGANVGWFIFYSIIVSIPAALIGGWLYGEYMGKKYPYEEVAEEEEVTEQEQSGRPLPSTGLSFGLILLPIALIIVATVLPMAIANETLTAVCGFFTGGSGMMSLAISDVVAMVALRKYIDLPYAKVISKTFNEQGEMFLILGSGGAFGGVIKASGIGDALVSILSSTNISVVVLAFLLCLMLRAALGSATVGMLTAATVLGPVAAQMGVSNVLLGLAICAAAVGLTIPTDGGFWLIEKLDNLGLKKTLWSCTGGTVVASAVAFAMVMLLSACSGFLPGI